MLFIGFWIQEEVQVETAHGSPYTLSRHNKKIEAPIIGKKFDGDDSAYDFYKQYAHRIGLSVRKK